MCIGGYAAIACCFILNKVLQAAALVALVEFELECTRCCVDGLGSQNCCRSLKYIIENLLNQGRLDGI